MITSIQLIRLKNDEHIQFNNDVCNITESFDPTALKLKDEFEALKAQTALLEDAYMMQRGSEMTKMISEADQNRDACITGIKRIAEGYTYHHETIYSAAALCLMNQINKYGANIPKMNYMAETASLSDLTDAVKTDDKLRDAAETLNLCPMFRYLEEQNLRFNDLFMKRLGEKAGKPKLNLRELRKESIAIYRRFIQMTEAHAIIDSSDVYKGFIKSLNALIRKYRRLKRINKTEEKQSDDTD